MKTILISDTHFGIKQNTMTWFKFQMKFIDNQLIPFIKEDPNVRLYHLGDVFDSRSSINPWIAMGVRERFKKLGKICKGGVWVMGGNHDYYSPNESTENVCSVELVLRNIDGVTLVTKGIEEVEGRDVLIPWYEWKEGLKLDGKRVFVHTDLEHREWEVGGERVFSGHIHTPCFTGKYNTLGSTYPLSFTDHDSQRGFYVLYDDNRLEFHPNTVSINFYRIYNEDVLKFDSKKYKKDDYFEFYIKQSLIIKESYIEKLKTIQPTFHNSSVIPTIEGGSVNEGMKEMENYSIENICRENIPKELQEKFEKILKMVGENDEKT